LAGAAQRQSGLHQTVGHM